MKVLSLQRVRPAWIPVLGLAFVWCAQPMSGGQEPDPGVAREPASEEVPPGPDDKAFAEIANQFPTRDFMTSEDYDKLIYNRLKGFLSEYPVSRHAPEVKRLVAEAESERQKVDLGYRKVDGAWLSENQYGKKKLQLDAREALNQLRERAKAVEPLEFIPLWERYEKEFLSTPAYLEAKRLAVSQLRGARMQITTMRTAHGRLMQERARTLRADPGEAQTAIMAQTAPYEHAREEAARLGHRWLPVNPFDLQTINEADAWIAGEIKRLTTFDAANHKATQARIEPVVAALNLGKHDKALKLLDAIPASDGNREMLDSLRDRIRKAKSEAGPPRPSDVEPKEVTEPAPDKIERGFKITGARIATAGAALAIAVLAFLFYRWSQSLQKDDK